MTMDIADNGIRYKADTQDNKMDSYEKRLESNMLRSVLGRGFFKSLTEDDFVEKGLNSGQCSVLVEKNAVIIQGSSIRLNDGKEEKTKALNDIKVLDFHLERVRSLGPICLCMNLTICDLSCNFIHDINALRACRCLVKLDVHKNQILQLPKEDFWFEMKHLQAVYLHDNGIATFEELRKLCAAPNILMLTLYDTPVSIKMHYRHFIVNSIWSLKSLDNFVVADEEIIEDARFPKHFLALQPHFAFKPNSLGRRKHRTIESEFHDMRKDMTVINRIQSKYCPVLIIQKFIRGHLIRLRYQYLLNKRLWAAVVIQRFYREYQGWEYLGLPIPQSNPSSNDTSFFSLSSHNFNYDTYMKYRRTFSKSSFSDWAGLPSLVSLYNKAGVIESEANAEVNESFLSTCHKKMKIKINIDLTKLETSTDKVIDELANVDESGSSSKRQKSPDRKAENKSENEIKQKPIDTDALSKLTGMELVRPDRVPNKSLKEKMKERMKDMMTVPVIVSDDVIDDDSDGNIPFRLSGIQAPRTHDLIEESTIQAVEAARDIRETLRDAERSMKALPNPVIQRNYPITTDQKLFIRTHGTMSLSCFRAVDQAYKDRDRAEQLAGKVTRVRSMKQKKEASCKMRRHNKLVSLEKILADKAEHKNRVLGVLEDEKTQLEMRQGEISSRRATREKQKEQRKKEATFTNEFVCQNNAVAKALASHAMLAARENTVSTKSKQVRKVKENTSRQKEIINRYNEHRTLLLQSEASLSRSQLDSDLMQRAMERESKAKRRVKGLKQQHIMKEVSTPCVATVPPKLPPLAVVADTQWNTWEQLPKREFKPRVHDRVNVHFVHF